MDKKVLLQFLIVMGVLFAITFAFALLKVYFLGA
jgi:hypothetical protein